MNPANYLLKLKTEIDEAKAQKARYEGQLEVLYKKLKDDFDVDTLEEAQELLEKKKKALRIKEARLERSIQALQERIENDLEK